MNAKSPAKFPDGRSEFLLQGPCGPIECISHQPAPELAVPVSAVLCHPHPLHGGTMDNKVVTIMERALRELGVHTVRFNFRGVGKSSGRHDDGIGETDDLLAVINWLQGCRPQDQLYLGGFSFGTFVALRAAQNLNLGQLILIAPPVDRYQFSELKAPNCPWLVIQGDADDVVSAKAVIAWAEAIQHAPRLEVMPEAGHFFHRRLIQMRELIKNALRPQLTAQEKPEI